VIPNGQELDTDPIPLAIAAKPGGGSLVAWMGNDNLVHIANLDCNDQIVGTPFSLPAHDFQDIAADANGGVILLTRDAQGGGTLNCGSPAVLCVTPNPPQACYDMYMVRFDNAGNTVWTTKLTSSSSVIPPYSTTTTTFIWWYQHHGRLAYDGTNYAAYFATAITAAPGGCVDVHQGDRMQVVGPTGMLVNTPDSFAFGCSHSWNTRIIWDDRADRFVMVCATDNLNRVAQPDPYRTIFSAADVGTLSVGDLINDTTMGYWVTASDQGTIRLLNFTTGLASSNITAGSSPFSHLVQYGAFNMLVAWETGSSITAQVRARGSGSVVSQQFPIPVADHRYQSFKSFPDGSVAYPAQGITNISIRIARLLPCGGAG
jgi:hypothetical protein